MSVRIGSVTLGDRPIIVAAGGEDEVDALAGAAAADVVELRADLFAAPSPDAARAAVDRLSAEDRPIIVTARHASEGGRGMPDDVRTAILSAAASRVAALDVEIAHPEVIDVVAPAVSAAGGTLIASSHAFDATPPAEELQRTIDRGRALGADIVKIATLTRTAEDLRTLLALTLANRDADIVVLGMGPWAALSRVALPAAGSLLTYASVGAPTAPGQLPLAELASLLERLYVS